MNLSEPFIRRPVMTVLLTVSVILFGVLAYVMLPVNDLPVVDYPVITAQVNYPGASPQTMANNVATPLERQFMQINGLEMVTSQSSQGHTSFTLQFALDKSVDAAATDVQTAITQAGGQLPVDLPSPPSFSKYNPNDQPILYIGLSSDTITAGQLYDYANTQVGERISLVNGVSQVLVYGTQSAVRIKANPSALAARNMTMTDLAGAVQRGTTYQGVGQLDGAYKSLLLQPEGQISKAADYDNLIVGTTAHQPVYLKDVAVVKDTIQDERISMHFWVRDRHIPSAIVVMAVFRTSGANAVEVARDVNQLIPTIKTQLPPSVEIATIHDRSLTIVHSVADVEITLVIAFILVVLVIFLFLGRATDTLIPAVALPLSVLLTFIAMKLLGYSLDNLSLMALTLAIGFLVDDAIVFLENTVRRMEHGEKPLQASINSAREISFTILSMTISLAAVFIPLVCMSGLMGRIFREFAVTIVVSIIASGLVSLTLTPLMCARLLRERGHGIRKSWVERTIGAVEHRVLGVYGKSLWFFLHHRWVSAIVWLCCMGGTVLLFMQIPKSFLPVGDSSFIMGVMIAQQGTSPTAMHQNQLLAEEALHNNSAVDMTFSVTGFNQFLQSNMGFLLAFLKEPADRKNHEPIAQVAQQLGLSVMGRVPGVIAALQPQPVLQISTGATNRTQGQFQYAISGIDPDEVFSVSKKLQMAMNGFKGFQKPVMSDLFDSTPSLQIDLMRDQAALYGVSPQRIEALLRNTYSQNYVYLIKEPNNQYQVILEATDKDRTKAEDLSQLYVRSDDGARLVPLSAVAKWHNVLGPQSVNHLNQFTSVTLSFNLQPGYTIGEATEFVEAQAAKIVPASLRGSLQGEALTFKNTIANLRILMFLAVFVMYVILGILYESYLHPLTVLSSLPVALVGGLATLVLFRQEASLYAYVGMFMLMGIVKKNGIMVVDFAIQRVAAGETAIQSIHDASMDRFRPIIMTTMAAVMGAIPIALGFGADAESRRPLGLVVVGGLLVSQFITLYITPAIYLYLEDFQEKVLDRIGFFRSSRAHAPGEIPPPAGTGVTENRPVLQPLPVQEIEGNGNGNGNGH